MMKSIQIDNEDAPSTDGTESDMVVVSPVFNKDDGDESLGNNNNDDDRDEPRDTAMAASMFNTPTNAANNNNSANENGDEEEEDSPLSRSLPSPADFAKTTFVRTLFFRGTGKQQKPAAEQQSDAAAKQPEPMTKVEEKEATIEDTKEEEPIAADPTPADTVSKSPVNEDPTPDTEEPGLPCAPTNKDEAVEEPPEAKGEFVKLTEAKEGPAMVEPVAREHPTPVSLKHSDEDPAETHPEPVASVASSEAAIAPMPEVQVDAYAAATANVSSLEEEDATGENTGSVDSRQTIISSNEEEEEEEEKEEPMAESESTVASRQTIIPSNDEEEQEEEPMTDSVLSFKADDTTVSDDLLNAVFDEPLEEDAPFDYTRAQSVVTGGESRPDSSDKGLPAGLSCPKETAEISKVNDTTASDDLLSATFDQPPQDGAAPSTMAGRTSELGLSTVLSHPEETADTTTAAPLDEISTNMYNNAEIATEGILQPTVAADLDPDAFVMVGETLLRPSSAISCDDNPPSPPPIGKNIPMRRLLLLGLVILLAALVLGIATTTSSRKMVDCNMTAEVIVNSADSTTIVDGPMDPPSAQDDQPQAEEVVSEAATDNEEGQDGEEEASSGTDEQLEADEDINLQHQAQEAGEDDMGERNEKQESEAHEEGNDEEEEPINSTNTSSACADDETSSDPSMLPPIILIDIQEDENLTQEFAVVPYETTLGQCPLPFAFLRRVSPSLARLLASLPTFCQGLLGLVMLASGAVVMLCSVLCFWKLQPRNPRVPPTASSEPSGHTASVPPASVRRIVPARATKSTQNTRASASKRAPEPTTDASQIDLQKYNKLRKVDVQALLRARSCAVTGNKGALITRLVDNYRAELDGLSYRQLQGRLKQGGLKQTGKREDLTVRLLEAGF